MTSINLFFTLPFIGRWFEKIHFSKKKKKKKPQNKKVTFSHQYQLYFHYSEISEHNPLLTLLAEKLCSKIREIKIPIRSRSLEQCDCLTK